MAGLYDADKKLPMPGYMKGVLNAVNMRAAFLYLIPHGPAIPSRKATWGVDMPNRQGDPTGAEGSDKTDGFEKHVPEELECYAQRVESRGWKVTDLSNVTDTFMVKGKQSPAEQQAKDAANGLMAVQNLLLGNQDTASAKTADDGMDRTRAAFCWLDSTAQGVLPVPATVRPETSQNYTGSLAAFTEAVFMEALRVAGEQIEQDVDLVGYVGSLLAQHMANWNAIVPVTAATEASTRMVTSKQDEKRIIKKVQFFDYEGASVKTILQRRLACDSDGAKTAYTPRSGLFLNMQHWVLEWLEPWHHFPLLDQGGGPRGFHKGWVRLVCKCPLGQVRAYIGS